MLGASNDGLIRLRVGPALLPYEIKSREWKARRLKESKI